MSGAGAARPRLLDPTSTAAVILGAHDWTEAGLGRAPSFLRSARGIVAYLYDASGLGIDPELVLDLFDDPTDAGGQLARVRDTLDALLRERRAAGRPVSDVLVYYVGHGFTDDQGHLSLLVRRSRRGLEAETGIKAPDLAHTLRLAAPQQRRSVILDCCFSEAAAKAFFGMASDLNQQVAATAAKDLRDDQPARGTLLLCSSPTSEVSMGAPNAEHTLFTGAVLNVLRRGAEGFPPVLSFADLRDTVFEQMVVSFGANAPRPALHQVNAAYGDLTRVPAFPNRAPAHVGAPSPEPPALSESAPVRIQSQPEGTAPPPLSSIADRPESETSIKQSANLPPPHIPRASNLRRKGQWLGVGMCIIALIGISVFVVNQQEASKNPSYRNDIKESPQTPDPYSLAQQRVAAGDNNGAARLFRLAADQGDARGQVSLAHFYEEGRGGLPKDDTQAARLYKLAADQGDASAQVSLGIFYEEGRGGLPKDDAQAARLYKLAADQGDASAQVSLGIFYEEGRGGLPKDDAQAARLYKLAADQGDASAQVNLGRFYEVGRGGVSKDGAQAARLYKLAADQGDASAQVNLGILYEEGRGLLKDDAQAARLYKLAADQGDASAQVSLGIFYEEGRGGLPKDDVQAARLYKLAADQGDASAQVNLGRFYEGGRGGLPKDDAQAARLYKLAADQGNTYAQVDLGILYEQGRGGLQQDSVAATRLYQQAARSGNTIAKQRLTQLGKRW